MTIVEYVTGLAGMVGATVLAAGIARIVFRRKKVASS